MEINTNDDMRIVSVWLTNAEKGRSSVRKELEQICAENKARKYKTAVFLSGDRDLVDCTQSLLHHNRYPKSTDRSR